MNQSFKSSYEQIFHCQNLTRVMIWTHGSLIRLA